MTDDIRKKLLEMADPLSRMTAAIATPLPFEVSRINDTTLNPAEWTYERLKNYIKDFESELDNDHEIAARLVSFGQSLTFHIEDMGYYGPDIITFYGKNDKNEPVQLIQHTSQLSVLLVAVKKQADQPRRIGFILDQKDKEA